VDALESVSETAERVVTTNDVPRWRRTVGRDGEGEWTMWDDEALPGVPLLDPDGRTNMLVRCSGRLVGPVNDDRIRVERGVERHTLRFRWRGKPRMLVDEVILWETRTVLERKETWAPREEP